MDYVDVKARRRSGRADPNKCADNWEVRHQLVTKVQSSNSERLIAVCAHTLLKVKCYCFK